MTRNDMIALKGNDTVIQAGDCYEDLILGGRLYPLDPEYHGKTLDQWFQEWKSLIILGEAGDTVYRPKEQAI